MNECIMKVDSITKRFGGLVAVSNVSIDIYEHEILGLIGPNGAGKTTCFNMIAGTYQPTSGTITYRGQSLARKRPDQICGMGIARTFQITKPFGELTTLENIMTGAYGKHPKTSDARTKAMEIFDMLQFHGARDQNAQELTTIDQKKLEIARAIATEPDFLLLDEVMAGCNPTEKLDLVRVIQTLREQGMTILIIEHDIKTIMTLCDRIFMLDRGEKISEGTPEEVANDPVAIKAYLGEDFASA